MTRDQILTVASNLFARQGYHGTTTREIAENVGIRQPSLFHHFESKAAIMKALLEHDLGRTVADRERIARAEEPAAVRLYRYVLREVTHIATSRYNVAGIYSEEVRTNPEFEPWYARRRRLHRAIERIVLDGQVAGEFVDFPVELVRAAVLGTLGRALTSYSGGQAPFDPRLAQQLSALLLRSLLTDVSRLNEIQETVLAAEAVSQIGEEGRSDDEPRSHTRLVSDETWELVAEILPPREPVRGGRWRDDRQILEAIAWRFLSGSPWRDLPASFGPWQTAWKRYDRWVRDGTWQRILATAQADPDAVRELEWIRVATAEAAPVVPRQGCVPLATASDRMR